MTVTYSQTLSKHNVSFDATIGDLEVPVLTAPQCQGDVGIWPRVTVGAAELATMPTVPPAGVQVVRGENGGNTHILDAFDGPVFYQPATTRTPGDITLGTLHVPAGSVAYLTHTDEHTTNGIGPGTYRITGKREFADEVRRVQD